MTQSQNQGFIKIQHGAFSALVLPENLSKVEGKLVKVKLNYKRPVPKDATRYFPQYTSGMGTSEYISRYESINNGLCLTKAHDLTAYPESATEYNPNVPLCVIDENPDYNLADDMPVPVKAKPARVSKQAARISELEDLLLKALPFIEDYQESGIYKADKLSGFIASIRKALNV